MSQGKELECRVLSIVRRRTNYEKYLPLLDESLFELEATRQIYSIISEHQADEKIKSVKLTVENLKLLLGQKIKNKDLLKECFDLCITIRKNGTKDGPVVESIVKDFAKRQWIKKGILAGLEELERPSPDFSKIQEHIDKALTVGTMTDNLFYNYFDDPDERIQTEKIGKRIVTGIPKLDEALDGGFSAGELVVILAPPERGKTLTLVNFGVAALHQGMKICYVTLELSERKIARRFDLRISGRPVELLRADPNRIKNPLASLRKTGCDLVIKDYSSESPGMGDLKSFIINYQGKMKKKFDMILIDYADLLTPSKTHKQERFGLKEIYTNLRRLANELKIPILTASQANRKSMESMVVTMKDFDECFAKAAIADVVFGLCQTPEELEDELCRIYIAKNRSTGQHKLLRLSMKPKTMFMGEFDRGENTTNKKKTMADRI